MRRSWLIVCALIVCALALGAAACGGNGTGGAPPDSTPESSTTAPVEVEGPPAPDFTLTLGVNEGEFTLSAEQKPVYLVFWAEW